LQGSEPAAQRFNVNLYPYHPLKERPHSLIFGTDSGPTNRLSEWIKADIFSDKQAVAAVAELKDVSDPKGG